MRNVAKTGGGSGSEINDLRVKSEELAVELEVGDSRRFSAQTRSQQQQILCIIQASGGDHVIFLKKAHRHQCQLLSTQTLLTSPSMSLTRGDTTFPPEYICIYILTRAFAYTRAPPPEKIRSICGVQFVSESK